MQLFSLHCLASFLFQVQYQDKQIDDDGCRELFSYRL